MTAWSGYRVLASLLTTSSLPKCPRQGAEADTVNEAEATIHWMRDDETVKQHIAASILDAVLMLIEGYGCQSAKDLTTRFEFTSCKTRL